MEFRSMFRSIFGSEQDVGPQNTTQFKLLDTYVNTFSEQAPYTFANDLTVRSIVDCISRHISKLKPMHVIKTNGSMDMANGKSLNYNDLLQRRPNPFMSTSDFLYKVASKTWLYGNCFIQVRRDVNGNVTGLYPLDYQSMELREVQGDLFCMFRFGSGKKATIPYSDIVHLRHNFTSSEILGDSPADILSRELRLLDTCKQSMAQEVKNATAMRGYLRYSVPVKEKDKEKAVQDFNSIANANGIGVLDADADYTDLSSKPVSTSHEQLDFIRQDIYRMFNVSEAILDGNFNEDEYESFYEAVLEPFAIQLGLELTDKLFTSRQRGFGNEILVDANRLQYASLSHKADMTYKLLPQGVITIDEAREMLNMPPCSDPEIGARHWMTLNNETAARTDIGGGDTDDTDTDED